MASLHARQSNRLLDHAFDEPTESVRHEGAGFRSACDLEQRPELLPVCSNAGLVCEIPSYLPHLISPRQDRRHTRAS
jgi:hypothetical protein